MRRAKKNEVVARASATATITGVLKEVYEGKKYDYATVRVDHTYDEYYDLFKVACGKGYELPEDGAEITLECTMRSYKGEISFKEVSADTQ